MIITTTAEISGKKVKKTLGVVTGSTVRAKHLGKDIIAGFRNLIGGEINEYTEMMVDARNEAIQRMKESAKNMEADAVINVRFTTSMIAGNTAELLAYGTAVKLA